MYCDREHKAMIEVYISIELARSNPRGSSATECSLICKKV